MVFCGVGPFLAQIFGLCRLPETIAVFTVASVLDVARALALVSRAPHRGVRPRPAAAAS